MGEPKVTYDLRQVIFDVEIPVAGTTETLAAEDFDGMTNYAHADEDGGAVLTNAGGGGTTGLTAVAARHDHPRNVVLTIVRSGITGGYIRVCGIGMQGLPTNELFTHTGASATLTGNVPFLRVDEVHVWGITGTADANDHLSIGIGAKLGLPMGTDCVLFDVVKERFGVSGTESDVAVTPGNINRTYGTYTPTSTLDAAKVIELWYVVKRTLTY
jgi:hypothetical protein